MSLRPLHASYNLHGPVRIPTLALIRLLESPVARQGKHLESGQLQYLMLNNQALRPCGLHMLLVAARIWRVFTD